MHGRGVGLVRLFAGGDPWWRRGLAPQSARAARTRRPNVDLHLPLKMRGALIVAGSKSMAFRRESIYDTRLLNIMPSSSIPETAHSGFDCCAKRGPRR